jgi:hypothetical protein
MCFRSHLRGVIDATSHLKLKGSGVMVAKAGEALRTAWPLATVGLTVALSGVWIAALGYGVSKLF